MILSYGSDTVELKGPEFGNNNRQDFRTITRESRHGSPLGYRDPDWPITKTKFVNSNTNTLAIIDELKAFLLITAGLEVKLTDSNDDAFVGFIVTNENEIITMKDTCSYDVSFEFMWSRRVDYGEGLLPALIASGIASVFSTISAVGAGVLPSLEGAGLAERESHAGGIGILPALEASGTGQRGVGAAGTPSLTPLTASGEGIVNTTITGSGTPGLTALTAAGAANIDFEYFGGNVDAWNDGIGYYSQQFWAVFSHAPSAIQYQSYTWNGSAYVVTQAWADSTYNSHDYTSDDGDTHPTVVFPRYYAYTPEILDSYKAFHNKIKCEWRYGTTIFATLTQTW